MSTGNLSIFENFHPYSNQRQQGRVWQDLAPMGSLCRDSGLLNIYSANLSISLLTVQGKPNKAPCLMSCLPSFSGELYNPTKYSKDHKTLLFQTAEILALRTGECKSKAEMEDIYISQSFLPLGKQKPFLVCCTPSYGQIETEWQTDTGCPGRRSNNVMDIKKPEDSWRPWGLWPELQRYTEKNFTLVLCSQSRGIYISKLPLSFLLCCFNWRNQKVMSEGMYPRHLGVTWTYRMSISKHM